MARSDSELRSEPRGGACARSGKSIPDRTQVARQFERRAQFRVRFAGTVKVAAARAFQLEFLRKARVGLNLLGAVIAGRDFERGAAKRLERVEQRPLLGIAEAIASRMRDHSCAASVADPAHRLRQARPLMWHVAGLAVGE